MGRAGCLGLDLAVQHTNAARYGRLYLSRQISLKFDKFYSVESRLLIFHTLEENVVAPRIGYHNRDRFELNIPYSATKTSILYKAWFRK